MVHSSRTSGGDSNGKIVRKIEQGELDEAIQTDETLAAFLEQVAGTLRGKS
jgi:hypothetical protein